MSHDPSPVPVMQPRLPKAERLLPYLRAIDGARLYSNHGPLARQLAERLCRHYGAPGDSVLPVCNATMGLTVALMAAGAEPGGLALMPAWTFVATGHAARSAGLEPFLADVDGISGALTPALAAGALGQAPGRVAAVVPVSPHGAPLDPAPWLDFRHRTGIPVVIDAAAGFDSVTASPLPAVVSLHATKAMGAGEGGFILSTDRAIMEPAFAHANFGFSGGRISLCRAVNAKLSEYGAAVALAALDEWPERRRDWARVLNLLNQAVDAAGLAEGWPSGLGETHVSSTCPVRLPIPADPVAARLAERNIETRRWWQDGLHRHPAFAACPATGLAATETLATHTLGLPCHPGLDEAAAGRIVAGLRAGRVAAGLSAG